MRIDRQPVQLEDVLEQHPELTVVRAPGHYHLARDGQLIGMFEIEPWGERINGHTWIYGRYNNVEMYYSPSMGRDKPTVALCVQASMYADLIENGLANMYGFVTQKISILAAKEKSTDRAAREMLATQIVRHYDDPDKQREILDELLKESLSTLIEALQENPDWFENIVFSKQAVQDLLKTPEVRQ